MELDTGKLQDRLTAELQQVALTTSSRGAAATAPPGSTTLLLVVEDAPPQQKAMTKLMHERLVTRGRQVEAELARIVSGTYGLCCQCEAELDQLRLENDPAVVFCASCEAERDAR